MGAYAPTGLKLLTVRSFLRGWRDPKNRLWRVKIVDDGWTTKLTIRDDATQPPFLLTTTPTGIAMATPLPTKEQNKQTASTNAQTHIN